MIWMKPSNPSNSASAASASLATMRAKALALLARREHTRLELQQKLAQRGFPLDDLNTVLDELTSSGLLNEQRYAEYYAQSRAAKGYGPLRIANELRQRGIAPELAELALAELADDWLKRLCALQCKHFKPATALDTAQRLRQTQFFRQRGFSSEQIKALFAGEELP